MRGIAQPKRWPESRYQPLDVILSRLHTNTQAAVAPYLQSSDSLLSWEAFLSQNALQGGI